MIITHTHTHTSHLKTMIFDRGDLNRKTLHRSITDACPWLHCHFLFFPFSTRSIYQEKNDWTSLTYLSLAHLYTITQRDDMEHRKAPTAKLTTADSNNNNNSSHQQRRTKKRARHTPHNQRIPAIIITEGTPQRKKSSPPEQEQPPMNIPLPWTKRWTKWFSSCRSDRQTHPHSSSMTIAIGVSRSPLFILRYFLETPAEDVIDRQCRGRDCFASPARCWSMSRRCSHSVLWSTISCLKDAIEYRRKKIISSLFVCVRWSDRVWLMKRKQICSIGTKTRRFHLFDSLTPVNDIEINCKKWTVWSRISVEIKWLFSSLHTIHIDVMTRMDKEERDKNNGNFRKKIYVSFTLHSSSHRGEMSSLFIYPSIKW